MDRRLRARVLLAEAAALGVTIADLADALAAAGVFVRGAWRLGLTVPSPWHLLHAVTGGRLLAPSSAPSR